MKRMVKDVMTKQVVVVGTRTPYKGIVELMDENRVTAVPVIDFEGRAVGIVSEADLLLKEQYGPDADEGLRLGRRRAERSKAAGRTAVELMTAPVVTIGPDESLAAAARLMHEKGIKRLPVVDGAGRILGIVSRADLLRVFLRKDEDIRLEIVDDVLTRLFSLEPGVVRVSVARGVVTLAGQVEQASSIPLIAEVVERIDGVVGVDLRLGYRIDDARPMVPANPWAVFAPGVGPRP